LATPNLAPQMDSAALPSTLPQPAGEFASPVLFYGTFSLLLLAPLAFGSTDAWSIFLLRSGSAFLMLLWAIRQARNGALRVIFSPLFVPMLLFALLVVVQLAFGLTAYRHETVSQALLYCVYGSLVFLAVQTLQRTLQVKILACAFCAYGMVIALFAILQSLSSNGKIYWHFAPMAGGWIYGPYVNHNHYAGLMEMLWPIPVVMAQTRHISFRWRLLPLSAATLMCATIFLSGSRAGMTAFLAQIVLLGVLLGMRKGRRNALAAAGVLLVISLLLVWIGGQGPINRLASIPVEAKSEIAGGARLAISHDALKMFAAKPVLGWGLGNFAVVYPRFRSFYTDKFVNQAHNDYLQLLVELGVLGFAVMIWFLTVTLRGAVRKLKDWQWDINGAAASAALLGISGILVHSLLDFNLQIPANAALFYVFCAIAASDTKFGSHRRIHHRHSKGNKDLLSTMIT